MGVFNIGKLKPRLTKHTNMHEHTTRILFIRSIGWVRGGGEGGMVQCLMGAVVHKDGVVCLVSVLVWGLGRCAVYRNYL